MHPRDLPPCDLVMKGGVTSGVVYPGAVLELAKGYRFEKVGGASAGAIAAALAAAAEYARQRAGRMEMRGFVEIIEELERPGFVLSLFQPTPAARPLFELGVGMLTARSSRVRQARALVAGALRHRPVHAVLSTLAAAAVIGALAVALPHLPVALMIVLVLLGSIGLLLLASWAVVAPLGSMLRSVWRALPEHSYGLCSGTGEDRTGSDALTEWLHSSIQRLAELPVDQPLTFDMLEEAGIALQMVATDLGLARPVTIPVSNEQYLFSPAELRRLFPETVVRGVLDAAEVPVSERDSARTWFLPTKRLPVVVGVRLSATMPLLLSSVKLYSARPDVPAPVESFISDGGITSNFPIHFFDDWLPSHPTFGLDLVPVREGDQGGVDSLVFMPGGAEPARLTHVAQVHGVAGFLRQIDDAARNWRDELQAELPGFRDRVCQIRMRAGEGGFNLNADPSTVVQLLERGRAAGREILRTFDWDRHRIQRYAMLMELLQENLALLSKRFEAYRSWIHSAGSEVVFAGARHDREWLDQAERATAELLEHAPVALRFDGGEKSQPEPAMRIGPRV